MAITPKPANGVSGTYQGDPGTNSRYYWIQAIYPSSRAVLSSPVLVPNIASLNPYNNKVSISWRQVPGAIGYDVIVTTTSTEPTVNSTATIGLIFGTTSNTFTDQGQVLQSWMYETGTGVVAVGAAGPDGAIQYNAGSAVFGGSADFTRDLVTGQVFVGAPGVTGPFNLSFESFVVTGKTDYAEMLLASTSDGFAGNQYNWGFVAANGDIEPTTGNPATAGQIQYIGSIWMQQEDTTATYTRIDWGMDLAAGGVLPANRPMAGNGIGDVGIGLVNVIFPSGQPTNVSDAVLFIDAANKIVNVGGSSGIGILQVGDATKAAGIHVQGAGAFDVGGSGSKVLLWLDADDGNSGGLAITNQVAGATHPTFMYVTNAGDLEIIPDDGNASELDYLVAANQWHFLGASLQVDSWVSTLRNTAPADGDIAANELADWFDPANGAAFVSFKGKTADGTVVTLKEGIGTSSAPSTSTIVLPTSVYGGSAQLLGGPTAWETVIKNGTTYKRPLY